MAVAEMLVKIGADVSNLRRGLEEVEKGLKSTGDRLKGIGSQLTAGLTLPLAGAAIGAIKMSSDFNAAMANVASLIPGSTERVQELKASVQDLAVEVGKSTQDLADGLYQVLSAFGNTADTAKILEINAKAAAAGVASTTDAINLTSAVTKGYGDTSAVAVQQASDLALLTVRLGQTTFPELAGSIGRVTPLAANLGVRMQELFAVMATGTGVTGGAAEVSTQLRGILQALMAPTDALRQLLNEMGLASGQAMVEQLGLKGAIDAIVHAAEASGQPLQAYIGSIEGQTLAMALAGPQADSFTQKLDAMGQATGTTDAAFKEQTQGVNAAGFAWAQFQQKLAVTAQQMGDQLAPSLTSLLTSLRPLLDAIQSLVAWFAQLSPSNQQMIIGFLALAAAIGPLFSIVGTAITALSALSATFTVAMGPLALIVVGIMAVVSAGIVLATHWDEIRAWLARTWESIRLAAAEVWNGIKDFFAQWWPALLILFTGPIGALVVLLVKNWDAIKQATVDTWNGIKSLTASIWDGIVGSIKASINWIIGGINRFIQALNRIRITVPTIEIPLVGKVGGWKIGLPPIPEIPMLAAGGVVAAPTLAMIGEAGPEAVLPLDRVGLAGAGGPTILVTGNTFMSEYDMERFVNQKLMPAVQRLQNWRGATRL